MVPNRDRSYPGTHRVVIVGGGVAALEAVLALRVLAEDRVTIDVIAPDREFIYTPLLVGEPFGFGSMIHFDLGRLLDEAGARYHRDEVVAVDVAGRRAETSSANFPYDALLVASGTSYRDPFPGALTFPGSEGVTRLRHLLGEIEAGEVGRVVFATSSTVSWSLPLYELALMTANRFRDGSRRPKLTLITPEARPLACFGAASSAVVASRLEQAGIELRTAVCPAAYARGRLQLIPGGSVIADRVVTLATPTGTAIEGLPRDENGFVPVDDYGRVAGVNRVYAAGDVTSFPLKQGGLAAQQADVAAASIAAAAGALVTPAAFRPVLRGLLLTGQSPAYLRTPIAGRGREGIDVAVDPLWWPPAKIAARYLGPFLARQSGDSRADGCETGEGVAVSREFDRRRGEWHDLEEQESPRAVVARSDPAGQAHPNLRPLPDGKPGALSLS